MKIRKLLVAAAALSISVQGAAPAQAAQSASQTITINVVAQPEVQASASEHGLRMSAGAGGAHIHMGSDREHTAYRISFLYSYTDAEGGSHSVERVAEGKGQLSLTEHVPNYTTAEISEVSGVLITASRCVLVGKDDLTFTVSM